MDSNENKPTEEKPSGDQPFDPKKLNTEELQNEFQELIEKKFGGQVQVMSMNDVLGPEPEQESSSDQSECRVRQTISEFQLKPQDVKAHLDRFVIGQFEAKRALAIAICDHYNHLKSELDSTEKSKHYQKQNVLVMGPTGVGKTYLVRLIADLIGVPFVKADATRFSEVGYMGANVDDIVRDLVQKADGDKELASKGIVYVDEVDKLASRRDHTGRDVSGRGVQFGFLRLLENSDVDLNSSHDIASQFKTLMNFQKKGKADKEIVNTRNILFIFSGAFHGLEKLVEQRLNRKSIGLHADKAEQNFSESLKKSEAQDLVQFGFEHEFIGRLPIRVVCDNLGADELYQILTESEHSIVKQYQESFRHYGIDLQFEAKALRALAEKALVQKTGARALNAVFEEALRPFKFSLPSTDIKKLVISEDVVKNPQGALHLLLESH